MGAGKGFLPFLYPSLNIVFRVCPKRPSNMLLETSVHPTVQHVTAFGSLLFSFRLVPAQTAPLM